jgi:hypothetical protein
MRLADGRDETGQAFDQTAVAIAFPRQSIFLLQPLKRKHFGVTKARTRSVNRDTSILASACNILIL